MREMHGEENGGEVVVDAASSRCKVVNAGYEICMALRFGVGQVWYLDVDIKFVEKTLVRSGQREADKEMYVNYRNVIESTQKHFHRDYDVMDANAIYRSLAQMMHRYELMDWHSAVDTVGSKYEYGAFEDVKMYLHYFNLYQFEFGDDSVDGVGDIRCSEQLNEFPFRMCLKKRGDGDGDVLLYFEKDASDVYDATAPYSFVVKEYIDRAFEVASFAFKEDRDWDEIETRQVDGEQDTRWIRKCNYKLMVAKVCMEYTERSQTVTASIKLKAKNTKRSLP